MESYFLQRDLEYDPVLYQRDRGEMEWDSQSFTSTTVLGDTTTISQSKFGYFADSRSGSPVPSMKGSLPGYEKHLTRGSPTEYEMTRFGSNPDIVPLMSAQQGPAYADHRHAASSASLGVYPATPDYHATPGPQYPGVSRQASPGYREAPIHRPQHPARMPSGLQYDLDSENAAGRGAYRS
jgi:calcium permeable stress-gated cation channel